MNNTINDWLNKENCDRCGASFHDGEIFKPKIMSMYNEEIICEKCKKEERQRSDYQAACDAEMAEIKKGNYNFKGIGLRNRR